MIKAWSLAWCCWKLCKRRNGVLQEEVKSLWPRKDNRTVPVYLFVSQMPRDKQLPMTFCFCCDVLLWHRKQCNRNNHVKPLKLLLKNKPYFPDILLWNQKVTKHLWSCLGSHIVYISCHVQKTLSSSRPLCPLVLIVFHLPLLCSSLNIRCWSCVVNEKP